MCHYCGHSVPFSSVCPECGEEFDIEIPDEDLRKFITVGDIVDYLKNL